MSPRCGRVAAGDGAAATATCSDPGVRRCASCRASLRSATRVERVGTAIACAAAFPSGAAATTALLATGLGLRAAAGWTKRVIRGELAPEHVADRSVAAADDKPSPGGRDNTANAE